MKLNQTYIASRNEMIAGRKRWMAKAALQLAGPTGGSSACCGNDDDDDDDDDEDDDDDDDDATIDAIDDKNSKSVKVIFRPTVRCGFWSPFFAL